MKEKAFKALLEGIKQAREIAAGKRKPSRVFVVDRKMGKIVQVKPEKLKLRNRK